MGHDRKATSVVGTSVERSSVLEGNVEVGGGKKKKFQKMEGIKWNMIQTQRNYLTIVIESKTEIPLVFLPNPQWYVSPV